MRCDPITMGSLSPRPGAALACTTTRGSWRAGARWGATPTTLPAQDSSSSGARAGTDPGFNNFTYLVDPDGVIVEAYCDLLRIYDEAAYQPIDWSTEPRALNLWGPLLPPDWASTECRPEPS